MVICDDNNIYKLLIQIIDLVDFKDDYTMGHCKNVSKYAVLLGKKLGLNEVDLRTLEIGAFLHDVGKIGIPEYLLTKSSSLTKEEYEVVKKHTTIGEELMPHNGFEVIRKMIRSHHERIDGKGYPDGLKGNNIPYFARIISVVDTFDAMTTQRSYNKQKTLNEAFEELVAVSTKQINSNGDTIQQLDSNLVKKFIQLIKENTELMEEFRKKDIRIINERNNEKKLLIKRV